MGLSLIRTCYYTLQGNLGWALMQQSNYIEAEDAYRRALLIAPDNNKMCNLGICLMKQGRISEAKGTLRQVKPAVADGPRGVDSHLKAYERAQQMLRDLESEMMNKGGDRVEQRKLFDAFLGSSSIWQPLPCREQTLPPTTNTTKPQDSFADENINSNIIANQMLLPLQKSIKPLGGPYGANSLNGNAPPVGPYGNSLNGNAPPFFSSKFSVDPIGNQCHETLKRTRSMNASNSIRVDDLGELRKPIMEPENKMRRRSLSPDGAENKWADFLPDNEDFEEAIIAAVLGTDNETLKKVETSITSGVSLRKIDKRLKVFQDIALSLSPRA